MSFPLVVGVDISQARVALADTSGAASSLMLMGITDKNGDGKVLADTHHRCGIFARNFLNDREAVAVFYEVPMGAHPRPFLMQTVGAVAAGIYSGLRDSQAHPVSVWPINISTWKKRSVGHGNASKEQVAKWAMDLGLSFSNQDEADAFGVAFGGWDWLSSKALAA